VVWGSVSDWVAGVATTTAVVVALHFSRQEQRDRVRAQALRVKIEVGGLDVEPPYFRVFVLNKSDEPLSNTHVRMNTRNDPPDLDVEHEDEIPAQGGWYSRPVHDREWSGKVYFVDSCGRYWRHDWRKGNRVVRLGRRRWEREVLGVRQLVAWWLLKWQQRAAAVLASVSSALRVLRPVTFRRPPIRRP